MTVQKFKTSHDGLHAKKGLTVRPVLQSYIAGGALTGIVVHLFLRYAGDFSASAEQFPLHAVILLGGIPLLLNLLRKLSAGEFGSDLLAGVSITTAYLLGEYLAGSIVVLMLSGGEALENFAVRRASFVLDALLRRMPLLAHRRLVGMLEDIPCEEVQIGDTVLIFPHELCPVDGVVIEGEGLMDESLLTGEPFMVSKTAGSEVISGSINGEYLLAIKSTRRASDSRYAKIMQVMQEADRNRPPIRRLGDKLGSFYTPLALALAGAAWVISADSSRFLAVLVVATPCPLLIAIPVAIIGSISLAAKRSIIIKNPALLEEISNCRTIIFDKTGTLTYGKPELVEILAAPGFETQYLLALAASIERYSKHPLSVPILESAQKAGLALQNVAEISEKAGQGLIGQAAGHTLEITSRNKLIKRKNEMVHLLPPQATGLECVMLIDHAYAATFRFRDAPRGDSRSFINHLGPRHKFQSILLVSGDSKSEVQYLADKVGITQVFFNQSPEDKLALVRRQNELGNTLFIGDGINDAPAIAAATIGIAFGQGNEVIAEAADAIIMETDLKRVDELLHIGKRMHSIVLQSAGGGIVLSALGMLVAAGGYLTPVAGALLQEGIDLLAILNAVRAALPPRVLTDF